MAVVCRNLLDNSGNPVFGIPVKIGAPMSTLSQRFTDVGSIPEVLNYPGWTLVNGAAVGGIASMGGISNPGNFFRTRSGGSLYDSYHANLAELCCS